MTADDRFLSRWSRLKTEARRTEAQLPEPKADAGPASVATPPAVPAGDSPGPSPAAPEFPPVESLKGLASEYAAFLKPGVDEGLRRTALKKLFSDPYFGTFEKFAEYCEDYTRSEPIPPAMLKTIEHAKRLLFDAKEDEKKEEERDAAASAKPQLEASAGTETKTEAAQPVPRDKA
ncbi:MAG TPA: DUF3306 domain-containing protein [Burkholderiales bacterium]|nr:DUF3306 domain-containing protein [Burkholderiales bacterium]